LVFDSESISCNPKDTAFWFNYSMSWNGDVELSDQVDVTYV